MEAITRARQIRNYLLYGVFSCASIVAVITIGDIILRSMHGAL